MSINLELPKLMELTPRIVVIGVGGAGGNAINNMIASGLTGVEYVAANTDAQALLASSAERRIQLGVNLTEGLGAGSKPEIGEAAAEEAIDEIRSHIANAHMVFIAAGMGGGTGTGAAAVIARAARELGALTVGIVTKPFQFEGTRRQRMADAGIAELRKFVDTMIVIPNQNLFRVATEKTTFAEAFVLADQVLHSGVACIVDLIIKDGLINLDFADVRTVMSGMGAAMMGTGQASGERRALRAAEAAIANPLLDEITLKGAKGVLLSIIGGNDMTLYEVDEAASRVREEVDPEANIIVGATFDDELGDNIRVAIVASGMNAHADAHLPPPAKARLVADQAFDRPSAANAGGPPPMNVNEPVAAKPASVAGWPPPVQPMQPAQPFTAAPSSVPHQHGAGAAARPQTPAHPAPESQPRELWRGPGNVVIEEAPSHRAAAPDRAPKQPAGDSRQAAYEPFTPSAPQDLRRSGQRRVPDLEEFPVVGQRDYQAKAGRYEAPGARPEPTGHQHAGRNESQEPAGLLQRMMGHSRKPNETSANESPAGTVNVGARVAGLFSRNK
ncbi:MAG: cell division protein FtsZ [Hyphomicrobiaceae bacterium]